MALEAHFQMSFRQKMVAAIVTSYFLLAFFFILPTAEVSRAWDFKQGFILLKSRAARRVLPLPSVVRSALRTTYTSHAVNEPGITPKRLLRLMGHSRIVNILDIYARFQREDANEGAQRASIVSGVIKMSESLKKEKHRKSRSA